MLLCNECHSLVYQNPCPGVKWVSICEGCGKTMLCSECCCPSSTSNNRKGAVLSGRAKQWGDVEQANQIILDALTEMLHQQPKAPGRPKKLDKMSYHELIEYARGKLSNATVDHILHRLREDARTHGAEKTRDVDPQKPTVKRVLKRALQPIKPSQLPSTKPQTPADGRIVGSYADIQQAQDRIAKILDDKAAELEKEPLWKAAQ